MPKVNKKKNFPFFFSRSRIIRSLCVSVCAACGVVAFADWVPHIYKYTVCVCVYAYTPHTINTHTPIQSKMIADFDYNSIGINNIQLESVSVMHTRQMRPTNCHTFTIYSPTSWYKAYGRIHGILHSLNVDLIRSGALKPIIMNESVWFLFIVRYYGRLLFLFCSRLATSFCLSLSIYIFG